MREITTTEVEKLLKANKAVHLIDVREVEEVKEGKIQEAMHMPLGVLALRMHELEKDTEYIIVCRSGRRSGKATQLLVSNGYQAVNMTGGMLAWNGPVA